MLYSLFHRELSILPNKKYFYTKRIVLFIILGMAFLIVFQDNRGSAAGLAMYSEMVYFLLASLVLLAPVSSLDLIAPERKNRTLELLWLTDLSPLGIIVAKYFSRIFVVILIYLSALPLFLFCVSLGGISGQQIFASTCIILSFIFLGTAIGLLDSTLSRGTGTFSFVVMVAYLIAGPVVSDFISARSPLNAISPFGSMSEVLSGAHIALGYYNGLWQCALAICFIFLSIKILDKIYLYEIYEASTSQSFYQKCIQWIIIGKLKTEKPSDDVEFKEPGVSKSKIEMDNPITWYDYYIIHRGDRKKKTQIVIFNFILICTLLLAWIKSFSIGEMSFALLLFFSIMTTIIALWALFMAFWRSFLNEKQNKTWQFILKKTQIVIFISIIICTLLLTWIKSFDIGEMPFELLLFFSIITATVAIWTLLMASWRSFISEKQNKTWQFILMTDLSPEEIVKGKVEAIFKTIKIYYILLMLVLIPFTCISYGFVATVFLMVLPVQYANSLCLLAMNDALVEKNIIRAALSTFIKGSFTHLFLPYVCLTLFSIVGAAFLTIYFAAIIGNTNENIAKSLDKVLDWQ